MPKTGLSVVLVLAVSVMVLLTNLGGAKLWDRDEPRNAACTREMLERGDWITPYFNGDLRAHKPILTYWLMMASYAAWGENEFGARFPSAVLGIVTTLATLAIARRLFSRAVGLWSAIVLASSLQFCITSRAATPDAALICASTLATMLYVLGTFRRKTDAEDQSLAPPQLRVARRYFPAWPVAAAMYAVMGLGVLAKGPVGAILPTAAIGMFLLLMRLPPDPKSKAAGQPPPATAWNFLHWSLLAAVLIGALVLDATIGSLQTFAIIAVGLIGYATWRPQSLAAKLLRPFAPRHFLATCWQMRPVTAIVAVLAVAAPWYVWVGLRTDGAWLREFFYTHNFARATQVFESHEGVYLFYPASLFAGFFPWSILLLPAVLGVIVRIRQRDSWHIGYLFAACWIGVYIALFSLARTKLPSYLAPAYPAVAMMFGTFLFRWSRGAVVQRVWPRLAFGALALVGVAGCITLPVAAHILAPGDEWLGVVGLLPLAAAAACYFFQVRKLPHLAAGGMAVFAVVLMSILMGVVAPRISRHQQIESLLAAASQATEHPQLAAHGAHEPSWVFYWRRPVPRIGERNRAEVGEYFRHPQALLLTTERALPKIQAQLPPDVVPLARERFFLHQYDLILLGRVEPASRR